MNTLRWTVGNRLVFCPTDFIKLVSWFFLRFMIYLDSFPVMFVLSLSLGLKEYEQGLQKIKHKVFDPILFS